MFEPSKHLWRVWGLILNTISPLLPSCWGFSFALGPGVSPHSCSSAYCLTGFSLTLDVGYLLTDTRSSATQTQWPQDWKRSVFIPIPKKGNAKECSNHCTIAVISHASKVMLKILQARLQQYMNRELSDVQGGFRKGRGTRDQIANIRWIIPKVRQSQKTSMSALLTTPKRLTVWTTINYGKFFKRWEYQTT